MPTLYEIQVDLAHLLEMLTQDDIEPEELEEWREKLGKLELAKEVKLAAWAGYIKNLLSDAEAIRVHERLLKDKRERLEDRAEKSKEFLGLLLNGEKWSNGVHTLSYRPSEAVVQTKDSVDLDSLPDDFVTVKTTKEPNKKTIGAFLKEPGAELSGFVLEKRLNLQVK